MVRGSKVKIGRVALLASAAMLSLSLIGFQSWAEGPASQEPPAAGEQGAGPATGATGQGEAAGGQAAESEETPEFTEEVLADAEMIATGEAIWQEQCRHCHGRSAYPGKAPKLKPSRYEPEFVYDRVTHGFRAMPAWKDVYSEEERVAVTAYVLSKSFSP